MNHTECVRELLKKERFGFSELTEIMRILRSEEGCPWDIEQTHKSIRSCMIEEAYEVVEAIDTDNAVLLREELGDVLFQVFFHSQIESEKGSFCVEDVVHDICVKMIHRHPHVFAESEVNNADDALSRWESIKTEEKQRNTLSSRLRAVPPMLPALMRASKIAKKAWAWEGETAHSLTKELADRANALSANPSSVSADAVGDLLMSVCKLSGILQLDAEQALGQAADRLIDAVEADEAPNA